MASTTVREQLEHLRNIFVNHGLQMSLAEPATAAQIAQVEAETEIAFDTNLREFYRMTNGSKFGLAGCANRRTDELHFSYSGKMSGLVARMATLR